MNVPMLKARTLLLPCAFLLALPLTAQNLPKPPAGKVAHTRMAALYECPICHHKVSAAKAKSLRYTCPLDKGRLALVRSASLRK